MGPNQIAFVTPAGASVWSRWLVYSRVARIVIYALLAIGIGVVVGVALTAAGVPDLLGGSLTDGMPDSLADAVGNCLLRVVPTMAAYLLLVRFIERRRVGELGWRSLVPEVGAGLAAGFMLVSTVIGILTGPEWLSGGAFGPEASVVTLGVCLAASVALAIVAVRQGTIVPPVWRRARH